MFSVWVSTALNCIGWILLVYCWWEPIENHKIEYGPEHTTQEIVMVLMGISQWFDLIDDLTFCCCCCFLPGIEFIMNVNQGTVGSDPVILATAGYDHTVRFWQAHSGICTRTVQHQDSVSFMNKSFAHVYTTEMHMFKYRV